MTWDFWSLKIQPISRFQVNVTIVQTGARMTPTKDIYIYYTLYALEKPTSIIKQEFILSMYGKNKLL